MQRTGFRAYLPEWLLNTLFFFILSAVILQLLANTYFLRKDTALLQHAITACNEVAELFCNGDGSLDEIADNYPNEIYINQQVIIYLNEDFLYCNREAGAYYLLVEENETNSINIRFYEIGQDVIYSLEEVFSE